MLQTLTRGGFGDGKRFTTGAAVIQMVCNPTQQGNSGGQRGRLPLSGVHQFYEFGLRLAPVFIGVVVVSIS
jgi:hypothetical protein